ncbi:eCIS core domain-containing protein [Streptomyces sp. NPDC054932]
MHAEERTRSAEGRKGGAPARQPQAASPAPPPGLLALQSAVGNAAVVQLLRRAGHPGAEERHRHDADCDHRQTEHPVQRSTVNDVLRTPGNTLDNATRTEMEARLGADFSDVRIHTGAAARASAAEVGARAYTSGNHVVIGKGGADRHTLAHELTHVIQQRQGPVAGTDNGSGLRISDPSDRFEREAEANATRVLSGPVPSRATQAPAERSGGGQESVQRSVHPYVTSGQVPSEQVGKDLVGFGEKLDAAVQIAWLQATQNPTDANLALTDGYLGRWAEQWQEYLQATPAKKAEIAALVPAMAGYAIESLATKVFLTERKSWTGPASGLKFSVAMQVTHGNTRPDVVLQLDGVEVAWYDITSAKSLGHIFEKDGSGWQTKPYVAEIAYPQVTAQTVESNATKWQNAGSPAITNDPMIFANYWMERGRFELSMQFMRQDILQTTPSLFDHARNAADNVTNKVNAARRQEYMRACLALYKAGVLAGNSSEADVADKIANRDQTPGVTALAPLPKDTAAVIQLLTGNHKKYGFQGSDGKSSFKSLSVQPGIVWLQECAAHKQLVITDADVLAHVGTTYPEGLTALRNAGLVT